MYPTPSQKLVFQKKETTQNVLTFDVYMYFEHLRLRWFHILFCPNIYNCSYFWSWKIDYTNSLIFSNYWFIHFFLFIYAVIYSFIRLSFRNFCVKSKSLLGNWVLYLAHRKLQFWSDLLVLKFMEFCLLSNASLSLVRKILQYQRSFNYN